MKLKWDVDKGDEGSGRRTWVIAKIVPPFGGFLGYVTVIPPVRVGGRHRAEADIGGLYLL